MNFVDTHCHLHEIARRLTPVHDKWIKGGITDADSVLRAAREAGVTKAICVGTTRADSELAVEFVKGHENLWASIGIHPHEAQDHLDKAAKEKFALLATEAKVVAVGECGLDYYYEHSPKEAQIEILKFQIELALQHDLPLIFHVRDAFDDFWPIFDNYKDIRGVVHSFSATEKELGEILARPNLYVGLNGIMTFTKRDDQLAAAKQVPLERLLLETDAPFLTPVPYRGKVGEPRYVRTVAAFLADLRGETLESLATATTANAGQLFNLD